MQEIINNIKTSSVKPYERNARKNDKAVDEVIKSIKRVGYRTPIIVDENNVILCGHTRYKAIVKMGWSEIPFVVRYIDLTEEQKHEYRIRDNKTGEIAEWDFEILEADFTPEQLYDFGFDISDLTQPEVEEDEAPPVPEIPRTIKGDIYTLGNHRVMCGDSTMIDDVEKLMGGKKANMMHTDPPYGVSYEGIPNDTLKKEKLRDFLTSAFTNAYVALFEGSNVYVWHADITAYEFIGAFRDSGFHQASPPTIQWVKDSFVMSQGDYHSQNEPCLYGWKDGQGRVRVADRKQTTLWRVSKTKESKVHPTMKPIELCSIAILNSSMPNTIILDLFLGSGSTLIACEQTNRICYGMELDEKYCDVIVQRWVNFTGGKVIRNGEEIEWDKTA